MAAKTESIHFRLHKSQFEHVLKYAKKLDMNPSEVMRYILAQVVEGRITIQEDQTPKEFHDQLKKLIPLGK